MRSNRLAHRSSAERFRRDEQAVSVMVGALLLVAIFVSTMITVRVSFVPVWEEELENDLARKVELQLSDLKVQTDRLVGNQSDVPIASPITLGSSEGGLFRLPKLPNHLEFRENAVGVTMSATDARIHRLNETDHTRLNESYTHIVPGSAVPDVYATSLLRLRIDQIDKGDSGASVVVTATDDQGTAGTFRVEVLAIDTGFAVITRTTDRWGTVLHNASSTHFGSDVLSPYWIDVLEPKYLFAQLLNAAGRPYTLSFQDASVAAHYAIAYQQQGTDGVVAHTDGGLDVASWSRSFPSGSIAYTAQHRYYVENQWSVENGAVVLEQNHGTAMRVHPHFKPSVVSGAVGLSVVLPSITGQSTSVSGTSTATVYSHTESQSRVVLQASELTMQVTTQYPLQWSAFWNERLEDVGLTQAGGHFTMTSTDHTATLAIHGLSADPNDRDIYLDLRQGDIEVEIQG